MSTGDDRIVAAVHDRVTNHIFGAGLTLASIVSSERVADDIKRRLLDAIDELDAALCQVRTATLSRMVADRDASETLRCATNAPSTLTESDTGRATLGGEVRRRLRRVADDAVFAYALRGHDFYRAADHELWAHESDDLLLSARSGAPFARCVNRVFYDIESDQPLYYEGHRAASPVPPFRDRSNEAERSRRIVICGPRIDLCDFEDASVSAMANVCNASGGVDAPRVHSGLVASSGVWRDGFGGRRLRIRIPAK